ncbi:methionyl-tRNA formyltransferase-like protein [Shewanella baltica]|uniref:hypothetical protein n=1 Tax=Shewanella baltica TaxID=62322 RepID=UPI00217F0AF2|nr:hypothetical protein [Shewanella baltica]MCS6233292.1 methionyl-tRNA formyltransferase-like protein [Shewanella baltica]
MLRELTDIIKEATGRVELGYFHLSIDGGDPIYRERVYCYELYHQLRCLWPSNTEYYLNGEIDKAAHPILRKLGADRIKPDFLVHKPGDMSGNYAVIEVKKEDVDRDGLKKDLTNLLIFLKNVRYERAIYLIYGFNINESVLLKLILNVYEEISGDEAIEIWFHRAPNQQAEHVMSTESKRSPR